MGLVLALGRASRAATHLEEDPCEQKSVWIDVGAHSGESTLWEAHKHRDCVIYAFEPNIKAINHAFAALDNYVVVPVAVTESDGFTKIYLNGIVERFFRTLKEQVIYGRACGNSRRYGRRPPSSWSSTTISG